jgi:outer membrane biosynthesis protein TonB
LSVGFAGARLPPIVNPPIEVAFVDEVGLESASPAPASEAAPRLAEVEAPAEPTPLPIAEPEPVATPQPRISPAPRIEQPRQKAVTQSPRREPPRKQQEKARKAGGRLDGILKGISDRPSQSRSETPPAQNASPAVRASLGAEVRRQLKPHWRAPTGADAEQLRTELAISLARNGEVTNVEVIRTTGQTASNRPQVRLHQEQAIRAVRLAAPFRLPAEFYDAWKALTVSFDKRLSQ